MIAHNNFPQKTIMHANEPAQTGTQTLIQTDTHHKVSTTGVKQYKKACIHYTTHVRIRLWLNKKNIN